jgi:hypothetical protein
MRDCLKLRREGRFNWYRPDVAAMNGLTGISPKTAAARVWQRMRTGLRTGRLPTVTCA